MARLLCSAGSHWWHFWPSAHAIPTRPVTARTTAAAVRCGAAAIASTGPTERSRNEGTMGTYGIVGLIVTVIVVIILLRLLGVI